MKEGKFSIQESDTYEELAQKMFKGEISPDEYVQKYNELIREEAEQHWEPVGPHEHI